MSYKESLKQIGCDDIRIAAGPFLWRFLFWSGGVQNVSLVLSRNTKHPVFLGQLGQTIKPRHFGTFMPRFTNLISTSKSKIAQAFAATMVTFFITAENDSAAPAEGNEYGVQLVTPIFLLINFKVALNRANLEIVSLQFLGFRVWLSQLTPDFHPRSSPSNARALF